MRINWGLTVHDIAAKAQSFWELSAEKLVLLKNYDLCQGAPVYTIKGKYVPRGWTEWTLGFLFGSALLQFDATGEKEFLQYGKQNIIFYMPKYLTHMGIHDHGFNIISTYGNLLRLVREERLDVEPWERQVYELAIKCSAAVQARRWTPLPEGGFIYSFNGPHSLFADTIRTLRVLAVGHQLGHILIEEKDQHVSLLERLIKHAYTTSIYNVYYGEGRDIYDVRGRVAHESIFNPHTGVYLCPSTQQGYSPFSTWMRGLAWIMLGYAEELEFLETVEDEELKPFGGRAEVEAFMLRAAEATCDFYIENTPTDGIPYWDTGAPGLYKLGNYLDRPADPYNDYEPVDSSAATIAAQGLLRLGHYLLRKGKNGLRYWQAGLTVLNTLLDEPYLSFDPCHQGLILHSVYHRPRGWDYVPPGRKIPCGESSMWGDYHAREAVLYVQRIAQNGPYLTFWGPQERQEQSNGGPQSCG